MQLTNSVVTIADNSKVKILACIHGKISCLYGYEVKLFYIHNFCKIIGTVQSISWPNFRMVIHCPASSLSFACHQDIANTAIVRYR